MSSVCVCVCLSEVGEQNPQRHTNGDICYILNALKTVNMSLLVPQVFLTAGNSISVWKGTEDNKGQECLLQILPTAITQQSIGIAYR